jgi:hypothetical protein
VALSLLAIFILSLSIAHLAIREFYFYAQAYFESNMGLQNVTGNIRTYLFLVPVSKDRGNFLEALRESPLSAVVVLISFFGMWTVLGLAGFHTYLICVEQTTNEDVSRFYVFTIHKT